MTEQNAALLHSSEYLVLSQKQNEVSQQWWRQVVTEGFAWWRKSMRKQCEVGNGTSIDTKLKRRWHVNTYAPVGWFVADSPRLPASSSFLRRLLLQSYYSRLFASVTMSRRGTHPFHLKGNTGFWSSLSLLMTKWRTSPCIIKSMKQKQNLRQIMARKQ